MFRMRRKSRGGDSPILMQVITAVKATAIATPLRPSMIENRMSKPLTPMDAAPLISTDELAALRGRPDVKIIDASWWLDGRDAYADYLHSRIEGAVFFDLEAVSDQSSSLPHMLPSATDFEAAASALGIADTDHIIVYDRQGMFSAARVWWTFRTMGAAKVQVLDGGFPKWAAEERDVETSPPTPITPSMFKAHLNTDAVATMTDLMANLGTTTQILDARGSARFNGTQPEPRAGVRGGHMPGAINLPFSALLNADKTMKGGPELEAAFQKVGLDFDRPVITSCGSGVTAAILTLGLALLGKTSRLYDGSWSEWGSLQDTPIETTP